jgi:hypothetical protein
MAAQWQPVRLSPLTALAGRLHALSKGCVLRFFDPCYPADHLAFFCSLAWLVRAVASFFLRFLRPSSHPSQPPAPPASAHAFHAKGLSSGESCAEIQVGDALACAALFAAPHFA